MNRNCAAIAMSAGLALAFSAAADTTINTYPDWDGNITSAWNAVAQSFTAPTDNVLRNWTLAVAEGGSSIQLQVFAWDDTAGPVGAALYSSTVAWPAGGGDATFSGINLALTAGGLYGAVADFQGYTGPSVHFQLNQASYSAGDASWYDGSSWQYLNSGWNTQFRADFSAVPTPGPIALLSVGGLAALRRRR